MASDDNQNRGNTDSNMSSSNDSLWENGGKVPISMDPRSSQNMSQKSKRRRRTFAELCRDFVCGVNGCDRRYASAHALQQHKRIKHQQDNTSAQINVAAMKKRAAADVLPLLSLVSGQKGPSLSSPISGIHRQTSETGSGMGGMGHRERQLASRQYSYEDPYSAHGRLGHETGHYPPGMRDMREDKHGDLKPRPHMDSYYERDMDGQYHQPPHSFHHRPGYDGAPCTGPCCEHKPSAHSLHQYELSQKYSPQPSCKAGMSRPHPFSASSHPEGDNYTNASRNHDSPPYQGKGYGPAQRSASIEQDHDYYRDGPNSRYEPHHGPQRGMASPNAVYHRAGPGGEWEGEQYPRRSGNESKYVRGYYPPKEYTEDIVADAAGREMRRHSPYSRSYGHRDMAFHYPPEEWAQSQRDVRPMVVEEREFDREGGRRNMNIPSRTVLEQPHPHGHWNPVMQEPATFTAAV